MVNIHFFVISCHSIQRKVTRPLILHSVLLESIKANLDFIPGGVYTVQEIFSFSKQTIRTAAKYMLEVNCIFVTFSRGNSLDIDETNMTASLHRAISL